MNNIILVPSNSITAKEIEKLEAGGYIVIITDEPEKVQFIGGSQQEDSLMGLNKDTLLKSCMRVIFNSDTNTSVVYQREWLLRILFSEMGVTPDKK